MTNPTTYEVYKVSKDGNDVIIAAPSSLKAAREIQKKEAARGVSCYVL